MFAAVWGVEEPESSTTAQSHLSKEFGLGGEAETAVRISNEQLSVCGACAVTYRKYCHVLHCQLCPLKGPHSVADPEGVAVPGGQAGGSQGMLRHQNLQQGRCMSALQ